MYAKVNIYSQRRTPSRQLHCKFQSTRRPLRTVTQKCQARTAFGLHVTPDPENNPIDPPERFTGYHAATDLKIRRGELEKDVPVYTICSGEIQLSGFSEGYCDLIT